MMDIIAAARATQKYVEDVCEEGYQDLSVDFNSSTLQIPHQLDTLQKIIQGEVKGEKAHRWFGWAQCGLAANGIGDMNVYRAINYASRNVFCAINHASEHQEQ